MKLVLQCAMCGTHHPVGTIVCSTCRASGVAQLRLMFECQTCGRLDLKPTCETCPPPEVALPPDPFTLDLDDDLIVAEEVTDAAESEEDEKLVVDESADDSAKYEDVFDDALDADLSAFDLDLDDVFDDESETEFDEFDEDKDEQEEADEGT